jgi:hypothetical protein
VQVAGRLRIGRVAHGRQGRESFLALVPAHLARVAEPGQPLDLALALDAGGMILGQAGDQPRDPVADLQREVGGGGARELTDVLDGDLVLGPEALGMLGLAQGLTPALRSSCVVMGSGSSG